MKDHTFFSDESPAGRQARKRVTMLATAKKILQRADALLITAGAGIGVDSGLPDFRGDAGFWRAYPRFAKLGLRFVELANPMWFYRDPTLAWGFYGHRLELYRRTSPHAGFAGLLSFVEKLPFGYFVFTSNVDGHFQKAGFAEERIVECHGSIHHLQCQGPCQKRIWSAYGVQLVIDESSMRAREPLPLCPSCGRIARPNILMFGDWAWISHRTDVQETRIEQWLRELPSNARVAILECGAGTHVPTVRLFSERVASRLGTTLIRVNVREPDTPDGHIGLSMGAREAIARLLA